MLTSCLALKTRVDLRDAMEIAADRGDWGMLGRMLVYLKDVHKNTAIPVPIEALEAAVRRPEPGPQDWRRKVLLQMFREALLNRNATLPQRREIFQLLVELARNDRSLAVAILRPLIEVGLTIAQRIHYDLPGLVGLLVDAGANIGEHDNNGRDLLEIAIGIDLSLSTIEDVLMAFRAAGVDWDHDACLDHAMNTQSRPLAELLMRYGAIPSVAVETWFLSDVRPELPL